MALLQNKYWLKYLIFNYLYQSLQSYKKNSFFLFNTLYSLIVHYIMYIISIFVKVNYLRKYRNRFVTKIEIVSAMDDSSFLISPPDGFTDKTPVEYNGIYFTLSSAKLSQKSKLTSSGMVYTTTFEFSFPNFSGADLFMLQFQKISEIKITYNTKAEIRLNKNDIALNSPFEVEFESNSKTIYFSTQIIQIYPIKFNEQ